MTRRTPRSLRAARGFSLVEMVVSLAVIGLLLAGMTSAVVLATRALPHHDGPAAATVHAADALHRLRDDLAAATAMLHRTATSVTLHLPDRDGDGHPEVVTYAWAGQPGDPLTRAANGAAPADLVDAVEHFGLAYTTTPVATAYPGATVTSAETLLSSFDPSEVNDAQSLDLGYDERFAAEIEPTLPAAAARYDVTRILVYGSISGSADAEFDVQVRPMSGSHPAGSVTDSVTLYESDLENSYGWAEAAFSHAGPFDAGDPFAVVLKHHSGGTAGQYRYDNTAPKNLIRYDDGNDAWNYSNNDRLVHYVYGTHDQDGDDWTHTRHRVEAVRVELIHHHADGVTHTLDVTPVNAPAAADARWEADFAADPTGFDANADGVADWHDGDGFDPADLDQGAWWATDDLTSRPDNQTLDQPFTVDLWVRDTVDNGDTGGVRVRFDRAGTLHAWVTVAVDLQASGQVVSVLTKDAAGITQTWATRTRPADQDVHVHLAVDPTRDTVAATIDGEVVGSFGYERLSNGGNTDTLKPFVDGTNSGVRINHLSLEVGGAAALTPDAYSGPDP
ncbi:MAG: prepilin-type N-terminal cleavage/methylation domain-containing protein [Planctomycetota bacterium]